MEAALQQFDKDIKEEILQRVKHGNGTMKCTEIEEIGVKAGLSKIRARGEFVRLAGESWAGHIQPKSGVPIWIVSPPREPLPPWVAVDFHRWWFQRRGLLH
jgi:hypothetical protein